MHFANKKKDDDNQQAVLMCQLNLHREIPRNQIGLRQHLILQNDHIWKATRQRQHKKEKSKNGAECHT